MTTEDEVLQHLNADLADKYLNLWPQIGQLYLRLSGQSSMPLMSDDEMMAGINKMLDNAYFARAEGRCTQHS